MFYSDIYVEIYILLCIIYYRCTYDVSILAKISGSQAYHLAQIDIARRQDVSVNLRVLAATRQFICCGNTFTGTSRTLVWIHRTLQTLRVFLIPYPAVRICEKFCFELHYVHLSTGKFKRNGINIRLYHILMLYFRLLLFIDTSPPIYFDIITIIIFIAEMQSKSQRLPREDTILMIFARIVIKYIVANAADKRDTVISTIVLFIIRSATSYTLQISLVENRRNSMLDQIRHWTCLYFSTLLFCSSYKRALPEQGHQTRNKNSNKIGM